MNEQTQNLSVKKYLFQKKEENSFDKNNKKSNLSENYNKNFQFGNSFLSQEISKKKKNQQIF